MSTQFNISVNFTNFGRTMCIKRNMSNIKKKPLVILNLQNIRMNEEYISEEAIF